MTTTTTPETIPVRLAVSYYRVRRGDWGVADATVLEGPPGWAGRTLTVTGAFPPHTLRDGFAGAIARDTDPARAKYGPQYKLVRIDSPASPPPAAVPAGSTDPGALRLTVQIESIRVQRADSGWIAAYARVLEADSPALEHTLISIAGVLPSLYPGCAVEIWAKPDDHPQYGRQYKVQHAVPRLPYDAAGMRAYLQGAFKDVGPKRSQDIWDAFGMQTPEVLDSPDAVVRLAEKPLPGIAPGWGSKIVEQWQRQSAERAALLTLASAGLAMALCLRVARHFGPDTGRILLADPYLLLEVEGIGFRVADSVALRTGIDPADPRRLEAGLFEACQEAARHGGHCWTAARAATADAAVLLGQDPAVVAPVLDAPRGLIAVEEGTVWPASLWEDEQALAVGIDMLLHSPSAVTAHLSAAQWQAVFGAATNVAGEPITLSEEQQDAARFLVEETQVGILVGGPGVGKTQTLRTILAALRTAGIGNIRLCAPTGKAAKRMTETTRAQATTIHRLLATEEGDVDAAAVVVDEVSMLDLPLAARLVGSLRPGTRLLLIGDPDQLPSVGPGRVLADLLAAGVPQVRLTQVFRQAAESRIIQAAYQIIAGAAPALPLAGGTRLDPGQGDALLVEAPTAKEVARQAVSLVVALIPAAYGIAPGDVRVLVPVYKGACGIHALNAALQAALNPPGPDRRDVPWGEVGAEKLKRTLREGDRLLWLTNDKETGLVNGSEVTVVAITGDAASGHQVALRALDDDPPGLIPLRLGAVDAIHGYAMSVHKSQGSEYPAVVVVCHAEHTFASRRLIYTGVTRAKQRLIVLGTAEALVKAVGRAGEDGRRTALVARLARLAAAAAQAA
jgi:exodeoxyribonuclease V alpha subunit